MAPITEPTKVKNLSPGDELLVNDEIWRFERDWPSGEGLRNYRIRGGKRVELGEGDDVEKVVSYTTTQPAAQVPRRPWWQFWK